MSSTATIRRKQTKNFTVIGNEAFQDERLSLQALGLLCWLRSRPNDWTVRLKHLERRFGCGREKMQAIMRELIEAGWVLRQEARKGGRGTFAGLEYVVLDEQAAASEPPAQLPLAMPAPESEKPTAAPESGLPESEKPESEKPTPYKELTLPNTDSSTPLPPEAGGVSASAEPRIEQERSPPALAIPRPRDAQPDLPPAVRARFDRLCESFPRDGMAGTNRLAAEKSFGALDAAQQERVVAAAAVYRDECARSGIRSKGLDRWLRQRRFDNLPPAQGTGGAVTTRSDLVFVPEGSPQWEAWVRHDRALGRVPHSPRWSETHRADGWWFRSAWPPGEPARAETAA